MGQNVRGAQFIRYGIKQSDTAKAVVMLPMAVTSPHGERRLTSEKDE